MNYFLGGVYKECERTGNWGWLRWASRLSIEAQARGNAKLYFSIS